MERNVVLQKLLAIHIKESHGRLTEIPLDMDLSQAGFDSLSIADIIMDVEEEFDCVIRMDDLIKIKTLNSFADYIIREKTA